MTTQPLPGYIPPSSSNVPQQPDSAVKQKEANSFQTTTLPTGSDGKPDQTALKDTGKIEPWSSGAFAAAIAAYSAVGWLIDLAITAIAISPVGWIAALVGLGLSDTEKVKDTYGDFIFPMSKQISANNPAIRANYEQTIKNLERVRQPIVEVVAEEVSPEDEVIGRSPSGRDITKLVHEEIIWQIAKNRKEERLISEVIEDVKKEYERNDGEWMYKNYWPTHLQIIKNEEQAKSEKSEKEITPAELEKFSKQFEDYDFTKDPKRKVE